MEKISSKIKLTAILAAAVVVVCLCAASIIFYNSAEKPWGYGLYSWGKQYQNAMPWWGSHMGSMTESEYEAFIENYRSLRPSFSQAFQMLQELDPAVLVLLSISWLGIITLVILGLFCINTWANRINGICEGDSRKTAGALKFILLGIITFGIYNFLWLYMFYDRMQENAPRYNLSFKESGSMVLLWFTLGSFIIIGPFVAIYIIIKNMNALCSKGSDLQTQLAS